MIRKSLLLKPLIASVLLTTAAHFALAQKPLALAPTAQPTSKRFDAAQMLRDVQFLSSDALQGRASGSAGIATARGYVLKRFKESRLTPVQKDYFQWFDLQPRRGDKVRGVNVIGQIRGTKNPDKYIVITAHYDHIGVRRGQIYNGADDNASGTAALFSLAGYFAKNRPNHSLLFIAFDGEENGLLGSEYFVAHPTVNKSSIALNINMDMVSRSDKRELYATGTFPYPVLKPVMEKVKKQSPIALLLGHDDPKTGRDDWTSQSDQGSFHNDGIPFIYFGVEDHKDYHQPTDDFENIDPKFYIGAVETVLLAVEMFDKNLK